MVFLVLARRNTKRVKEKGLKSGRKLREEVLETYSSVLGSFGLATLQGETVALVLQALRCDEALDARCFGIWFLALGFGLYLTANDEFADLGFCR